MVTPGHHVILPTLSCELLPHGLELSPGFLDQSSITVSVSLCLSICLLSICLSVCMSLSMPMRALSPLPSHPTEDSLELESSNKAGAEAQWPSLCLACVRL